MRGTGILLQPAYRAQDVDDFFDPNHMPLTQEYVNLINQKQKFMCAMFSTALKNYGGKKFVREDEDDFNTQIVCKNLHGFYATSMGT